MWKAWFKSFKEVIGVVYATIKYLVMYLVLKACFRSFK